MSNIQDVLVTMVEQGAMRVAPAGPDVVLCPLCGHSVLFHMEGCTNDPDEMHWVAVVRPLNVAWPLPQAVAQACIERGVVLDSDLLRADMQGVFQFAPIIADDIDYGDPCQICRHGEWCDGCEYEKLPDFTEEIAYHAHLGHEGE